MRYLFYHELLIMRHSRAVKFVFWYSLITTVMLAFSPNNYDTTFFQSGYGALFPVYLHYVGNCLIIYAVLAGGLMGQEFDFGTMQSTVGRGVKRSRVFFVKVICMFAMSILTYLLSIALACLVRTWKWGYNPHGFTLEDYWAKVVSFHAGMLILTLSYLCVFTFLMVLFQNTGVGFAVSLAVIFLDAAYQDRFTFFYYSSNGYGRIGGAFSAEVLMRRAVLDDTVLTGGFWMIFVPIICIGTAALTAAFLCFLKRDMK